jgi:hypothetical protein
MKITYALMGSNNDPTYLDFWPIVSKVWKIFFNITPVLGLITNEKEEIIYDEYGIIIKLNPIPNYSEGLLSQLVRFYLPKYLKGNCVISDIDMIPLSKKYFIDDLLKYNNNDFIIMSSHHPQTKDIKQYPMCYVAGNSEDFIQLFNLEDDWITFISKIPNMGWYTDQIHLHNIITNNKKIEFKFPKRQGGFYENRIDRVNWTYDVEKLKNGYYIDCHSLRPYKKNESEINKLINYIL